MKTGIDFHERLPEKPRSLKEKLSLEKSTSDLPGYLL